MGKTFIIALGLVSFLSASAGQRIRIEFKDVAAHYVLQETKDQASLCPAKMELEFWKIDYPVIPVLSMVSAASLSCSSFEDPTGLGFGYPTTRISDTAFAYSYGPNPEYQGPNVSCRLDFDSQKSFTFTQVVGDVKTVCSYSRD